ncbi:uncharacterized protein BCR38DRAFT_483237 [Pseudomassariella vexata]|uniref:C2H2-type domain-containing protein n=1 Tax=Pseudomassariella vexata TaxID=1141098 RepID=A0A1Y2E7T0_9PEZI|nr:uncharacterized protein BCR38DRAFT_483237 [Pseudomassariella vexata]ORY67621.1 hypothetical protein BCR38DRAFT_483237 [Pseudomassariella vexata]
MSTTIYTTQPGAQYGYPQPPPSPPVDETSRCSLPSISNLLVMADAGSPTTESSPASQQQAQSTKSETRPNSSHYASNGPNRSALPPTPPMSSDASFEGGYNSPSMKSVSQTSAASAPSYYYESTPPLENDVQRQQMATPRVYPQQTYPAASYISQPPMASYYPPPMQPSPAQSQISGLYFQRPLPQAFPPLPMTVSMGPSGANPWQHHHYISPSSAASFPQSQDRYICQTCNKAFSRPSSLRIHSHSHTGEKPFKCPHSGCGKAFSVRSNMKRHERGCHNFESVSSSLH